MWNLVAPMCAALALVLCSVPVLEAAAIPSTASRGEWVNITAYRVTPVGYVGLDNMDTGDALGDVMFGLTQLSLPQLCSQYPQIVWCQDRSYLSGGNHTMVYTEFTITALNLFGSYAACDPCQNTTGSEDPCINGNKNGTFECRSEGPTTEYPPQCATGFDMWGQDCFNGTIYKTLTADVGDCCSACSSDSSCAGWTMPHGINSTTCQLMTAPLLTNTSAALVSACRSAQKDPQGHVCWYSDPRLNTTFQGICDPSKCTCTEATLLALGVQTQAMCYMSGGKHHAAALNNGSVDWMGYIEQFACMMNGTWYSTQLPGKCVNGSRSNCYWDLVETKRTVSADCVNQRVTDALIARRPDCWSACPQPTNVSSVCYLQCMFETMVGNPATGVPSMDPLEIAWPFISAIQYADPNLGGCPDVSPVDGSLASHQHQPLLPKARVPPVQRPLM